MSDSRAAVGPLQLSPAEFTRFSQLVDEAIDLEPAARDTWLTDLDQHEPIMAPLLRDLFASREACDRVGFLRNSNLALSRDSAAEEEAEAIGKHVGPYRILSLLGHGGMGSVWLAERADGMLSRQVALKLVHPALMGRGMGDRLAREREILGSLNHPNIARLLDAGFAEGGQPYLALEYVPGIPFTVYCDRQRLPIRARLELFRQVLAAVQYAHTHLVVHRDIKPSNVLVTEEGQVHLLDFGIAKLVTEGGTASETELTQMGGRALTPEYAAPEQITGKPITTASDVYALGVMLYETLTGERPYRLKRDSRGALEEAILEAEPLPPSRAPMDETVSAARGTTARKLARSLQGDLDTIVIKALHKSPDQRYATADAFAEDVERFLRGEVVLARRDSLAYRALKFARRHKTALGAAAMLLLTLIGGLVATTHEAQVASAERDTALQAQLRSLTQTAAARLADGSVPDAMSIIQEVLPLHEARRQYTPEALSVFQEARAADALVWSTTPHSEPIRAATYSPDGRRIATASYDGTARIWDAVTGREILRLDGHRDRVLSVAFSPDGQRLITTSTDKTARIWDSATGQSLSLLSGHTDEVITGAFSPDGSRVVTASYDKTARIWDVATAGEVLRLSGHKEMVTAAAFSPDSRRVITASSDGTARIWDASSGKELVLLSGHTDRVWSAEFSPDGKRAVTASFDKTARVWDVATGRELTRLTGHAQRLTAARFSPDGRDIVTASFDKTARIWDSSSGVELAQLSGHTAWLLSAAFAPDGQHIVTGSTDGTARTWNWAIYGRPPMLLRGHSNAVGFASFSADGRRIATASFDKTARIWDATTGSELVTLNGHSELVTSAAFSRDGRRVVTASFDKTARIWDAATGQQINELTGHTDRVWFAMFSPDGQRVVTASIDKTARLWDSTTAREITRLGGHSDRVWSAQFSPDGLRVVTASDDKTARIWEASTGRQLVLLRGHTSGVAAAAFSPDGKWVVTGSIDKTARIWDASTGRQAMVLSGHKDSVESAAYSLDSRYIVTSSEDRTVCVWDVKTGRLLLMLPKHPDRMETAVFSPDGTRILTTSNDSTPRIWTVHPLPLDVQLEWSDAAQFDPLPSEERFQLGLSRPEDIRQRPKLDAVDEPNALARLAERADAAASAANGEAERHAYWLQAFRYYAAAAERARLENLPDEAWRSWRYRRASLARILAQEDMMEAVARTYREVRTQYAPSPPSAWHRLSPAR